jgi:hypothetical protein
MFRVTIFLEDRAVYEIMWGKKNLEGHRLQYSTSNARSVLDKYGYKCTLIICDNYCFFFVCNNDCTNPAQCYATRSLPVSLCPQVICFESESINYCYMEVHFTRCFKTPFTLYFHIRFSLVIISTLFVSVGEYFISNIT